MGIVSLLRPQLRLSRQHPWLRQTCNAGCRVCHLCPMAHAFHRTDGILIIGLDWILEIFAYKDPNISQEAKHRITTRATTVVKYRQIIAE